METALMAKPQKVDLTKLVTVASYAEKKGVDKRTVYYWIKEKKVQSITIDGVKFVVLP